MSVIDVEKDAEARTLTLTSLFAAPPVRVWQVWADPEAMGTMGGHR